MISKLIRLTKEQNDFLDYQAFIQEKNKSQLIRDIIQEKIFQQKQKEKFIEYKKIFGWEAVEKKIKNNKVILEKYADPTEKYLWNIGVKHAEEVCRENPSLIFTKCKKI